jgi:hypothetical protein
MNRCTVGEQDFSFVMLPTQGMTYCQKCVERSLDGISVDINIQSKHIQIRWQSLNIA